MSTQLVATRYQLGERLGSGGVAVVYRAHDLRLDRPCALKILRDQYAHDPEFLKRFEREARMAAGLNHPNLVAVYDYGTVNDSFFIAMEYVGGGSLKEEIQRHGPLGPRQAVRIAREVLSALSAAHAQGLVHRDVKPQNVLLTADRTAKLSDFGIAHAPATTQLTQMGLSLGTAAYVAPEQAQGRTAGPPADVYGVGLLLYEMLTGRPPFEGDSAPIVVYRQVHEQPVPPSQLVRGVSPALDAVVMRALEKDPASRFPSAEAMFAALAGPNVVDGWGAAAPTAVFPAAARAPARRRTGWLLPLLLGLAALLALAYFAFVVRPNTGAAGVPAALPTAAVAPGPAAPAAPTTAAAAPTIAAAAPTTQPTAAPTIVLAPLVEPPSPQPKPAASPTALPSPTTPPQPTATTLPPSPTAPPPTATAAPAKPTPAPANPTPAPAKPTAAPAKPPAAAPGSFAFEDTAWGGAFRRDNGSIYRQRTAAWVYAANTAYSTMSVSFDLAAPPSQATFTVVGLSSENVRPQMEVLVNGARLYRGAAPFPNDSHNPDWEGAPAPWTEHSWTIPAGLLRPGQNTIAIRNLEPQGGVNQPPWVMVDRARLDLSP